MKLKWFVWTLVIIMLATLSIAVYMLIGPSEAHAYSDWCEWEGRNIVLVEGSYRYHALIECGPCMVSPCVCRGNLWVYRDRMVSPSREEFVSYLPFVCRGNNIQLMGMSCIAVLDNLYCLKNSEQCVDIKSSGEDLWIPESSIGLKLKIE